jgi:NADH-quinone oxidoreductase subunit A
VSLSSNASYYATYTTVLAVIFVGLAFAGAALAASALLRPSRPTPEKLITYESGIDPVGVGWAQSHVRYYVYAYLYVVFAVDAIYLFPWATVFAAPGFGWATLVEMLVFLGFIAVGLLYAWRKGVLRWT